MKHLALSPVGDLYKSPTVGDLPLFLFLGLFFLTVRLKKNIGPYYNLSTLYLFHFIFNLSPTKSHVLERKKKKQETKIKPTN